MLLDIYQQINRAKLAAGREKHQINLIAVSKTFPQQAVLPLIKQGHRDFAENHIMEALAKYGPIKQQYQLRLHLIGPIQSNKLAKAMALFDVIHSLGREKIAALCHEQENTTGRRLKYFIQINISNEMQKHGIRDSELKDFLTLCQNDYKLDIIGLMAIPKAEDSAFYFAKMHELQKQYKLPYLSMGMSEDFTLAIQHGATHIRIGRKLFGSRPMLS